MPDRIMDTKKTWEFQLSAYPDDEAMREPEDQKITFVNVLFNMRSTPAFMVTLHVLRLCFTQYHPIKQTHQPL